MNTKYLYTLPEVDNKYNVQLEEGEKVVFTAKLITFGNEKNQRLEAGEAYFTLTNKRILADNTVGVFIIDLENEVTKIREVMSGFWIFKSHYFAVDLNKEVVFDEGRQSLTGYVFYFNDEDTVAFNEIVKGIDNYF